MALWVGACAGRQRPVTRAERAESAERAERAERAENTARAATAESPAEVLQFDNQSTVYVDVYLVGGQLQWRLGRVAPAMHATLRVPVSAIDGAAGFVQLAVIPGSQMSAQAWRDPRTIFAMAQPTSEVLTQRWTFRQPDGAPMQLHATRLTGRR